MRGKCVTKETITSKSFILTFTFRSIIEDICLIQFNKRF